MKFLQLTFLFITAVLGSCNSQPGGSQSLDALSFSQKMEQKPGSMIIDVRTAEEFSGGYIPKAINVDYNSGAFQQYVAKLDKKKTYFIYCLGGGRSAAAANFMRSNGFTQVYDLKGGIMAWQGRNLPIEQPAQGRAAVPAMTTQAYDAMTRKSAMVLVDFYAPWCAPCKRMEPMLNELAKEYAGKVEIVRVNVDQQKQLAVQLGIDEIPVMKLYKKGVLVQQFIGYTPKEKLKESFR